MPQANEQSAVRFQARVAVLDQKPHMKATHRRRSLGLGYPLNAQRVKCAVLRP
jgi:hypothetical protein